MEVDTKHVETEIGVFPSDWEIRKLSDITESSRPISYGIVQTGDEVSNGVRCIRVVDIKDGVIDDSDLITTSQEISDSYSRTILREGDAVIALRGKIGEVAVVPEHLEGANLTRGVALLAVIEPYSERYVKHFLSSPIGKSILEKKLNGSALQELPISSLRKVKIACPPRPEQRAIKTATMQRLLTGQQRLPGFSAPWTTKRLGQIAEICTGKKDNQDKVDSGPYPFFVRSEDVERIDTYSFDGEAILVPGEGRIGDIFHYVDGKFDYHQRVYKVSDFSADVSGKFVYYYMSQHFGEHAMRNSVKATVDSLRLPTFEKFELPTPSLDEQKAVVDVLADMDAEIEALQGRRDKTQVIKQGMMQELLTGRTRLV